MELIDLICIIAIMVLIYMIYDSSKYENFASNSLKSSASISKEDMNKQCYWNIVYSSEPSIIMSPTIFTVGNYIPGRSNSDNKTEIFFYEKNVTKNVNNSPIFINGNFSDYIKYVSSLTYDSEGNFSNYKILKDKYPATYDNNCGLTQEENYISSGTLKKKYTIVDNLELFYYKNNSDKNNNNKTIINVSAIRGGPITTDFVFQPSSYGYVS